MATKAFTGGAELERKLLDIAKRVRGGKELSVGFMKGATYPDGEPVAYIASIHEFGMTINVPQRTTTIYRKLNKDMSFAKNGRFVKAKASNYATNHIVPAHQIKIPARPFFRTMIADKQSTWGDALGKALAARDYDGAQALGLLGILIQGQLQNSIRDIRAPSNAASTVAAKGFDNPLIHTGHMLNSVSYSVMT
jgi:hypothetical protein